MRPHLSGFWRPILRGNQGFLVHNPNTQIKKYYCRYCERIGQDLWNIICPVQGNDYGHSKSSTYSVYEPIFQWKQITSCKSNFSFLGNMKSELPLLTILELHSFKMNSRRILKKFVTGG